MVSRVNSGGPRDVFLRTLPNERYLGALHVKVQGHDRSFKVYSEASYRLSNSQQERLKRIIEGLDNESPFRKEVDLDGKRFIVMEIPSLSEEVPVNEVVKKLSSLFFKIFGDTKQSPTLGLSDDLKKIHTEITHQRSSFNTATIGVLKERIMSSIEKYQYRPIPYDSEAIRTCMKEQ
ncbi:MAG: hypothetical protein ACI9S8_003077 [Chlamydiales bacterium]|jgi:hypothetical protein